jgi:hypothetical protein
VPEPGSESPCDSGCPAQHCQDGECVFMAAGKTVVVKTNCVAFLPQFFTLPVTFTAPPSPSSVATFDSGGSLALPVRIHLLHQVLLI